MVKHSLYALGILLIIWLSPFLLHRTTAYQRLRELVYTSPYIDPDYVLSKLPPDSLLEIRALMLERLDRHQEALSLYVRGLKNLGLAEAYCDRVYAAAVAELGAPSGALGSWGARGGAAATAMAGGGVGGGAGGSRPGHAQKNSLLRWGSDASSIYMELLEAVLKVREGPGSRGEKGGIARGQGGGREGEGMEGGTVWEDEQKGCEGVGKREKYGGGIGKTTSREVDAHLRE